MGQRTRYLPGTFSWVDLGTTDAAGAKSFYGELFGWEAVDMPAGEALTYTMLRIDGDDVGALYEQSAEMRERDVPPAWLSYVTVDDAEATAAKVPKLGGSVHAGPFDVMDAGRMALLQDPTGAMLAIWEPRRSIGATRVNDPGCLTWNELSTSDTDAARGFYSGLFGWETAAVDTGGAPPYWIIKNAGSTNGGLMALTPQHGDAPPHWLPYFTVESTTDTISRVDELGGRTFVGPFDVPTGRIAAFGDPQGAAFAVFEGEVDE